MSAGYSMVHPMRSARRSGPCIMGGVSPSLHHARQSVTGPIFTGLPQPLPSELLYGSRGSNSDGRGEVASSGSSQSQDLTKASRRALLTSRCQASARYLMVYPKRSARRSGPCIMGGVSPSLHPARQSVTGPIFTGRPQPPMSGSRYGSLGSKPDIGGGVASSGSSQSRDLTKASRRALLASRCQASARYPMVFPERGARRSGPCIMGGVSPSLHHARQSVTGPIFTGPAQTTCAHLQLGFQDPNCAQVVGPASSGSSQSQDLTKASRRTPLSLHSRIDAHVAAGLSTSEARI